MRVFYAVHNHYWEDANLLSGLRDSGCEVVTFDPGAFTHALSAEWSEEDRARNSEQLLRAVKTAHAHAPIDLFFAYVFSRMVLPEAIREIGRMGIPTVNYWCNGAHQFPLVEEISPAFELCIATERMALPFYKKAGARPFYLQMAANPAVYKPYDVPRQYDVTFVGQRYADRPIYILHLLKNGVKVRAWGPGWTRDRTFGEKSLGTGVTPRSFLRHPRSSVFKLADYAQRRLWSIYDIPPRDERRLKRIAGPSLPQEELVKMYSRSHISLGFSTVGNARYNDKDKTRQIHLRDFEAPMSGGLHFVEYQDDLQEFYDIGREIVCYTTREGLLDKTRFYLAHPEEAASVRQAGHKRALQEHTWTRRFQKLFRELHLKPPKSYEAVSTSK